MRARTDVEDEGLLKPRNQEVSSLTNGVIDDTAEAIKENGAFAAVDSVDGGAENSGADAKSESGACDVGEK